jgi:mannosyl-oligosaccharide glucosidase
MVKIAHWVSAATLALGVSAADDASSVLTTEIGRQNNQSLFWGPYKSNLYFGVRPRTPDGLWTGLMWGKVDNYHDIQNGKK